jgi:hypothetical protein
MEHVAVMMTGISLVALPPGAGTGECGGHRSSPSQVRGFTELNVVLVSRGISILGDGIEIPSTAAMWARVVSHRNHSVPLKVGRPEYGETRSVAWDNVSLKERQGFDKRTHVSGTRGWSSRNVGSVHKKGGSGAHVAEETVEAKADIEDGGRGDWSGRERSSLVEQDGEHDKLGRRNDEVKADVFPSFGLNSRRHIDDAKSLMMTIDSEPGYLMSMFVERPGVEMSGWGDGRENTDVLQP